ncbi:hypothetical protein OF83DRAFT_1176656 [Amylostereum chailletii]|nr:hypothetical protein OF83DRAFT_1176656 [Amylostereum chailletii]
MVRKPLDPDGLRARRGRQKRIDACLKEIKSRGFNLYEFLEELLTPCDQGDPRRSRIRVQMLRNLLAGHNANSSQVEHLAELLYNHPYSRPRLARASANRPANEAVRRDRRLMARWRLLEWAICKVEEAVSKESAHASSKEGGLHMPESKNNWETLLDFSMHDLLRHVQVKLPILLRILIAAAFKRKHRPSPDPSNGADLPPSYDGFFSRPIPTGSGSNPRDPFMMVLAACVVLLTARNRRFNLFQRIVGVWMFSHTAPHGMYAVLGRLGVSISYTSVLSFLHVLSCSAQDVMRKKALRRAFLLIYDNINHMSRVWNPEFGQKDTIHNGTAATFVELEDCDIEKAFDIEALNVARREQRRRQLTVEKLHAQIQWDKLHSVMALHCLNMLINAVPTLAEHRDTVLKELRTTHAMHRMPEGRKTKVSPMQTSDYNEGNTGENASVLDNLLLRQLGLPKEEVARLLVIIGGDQSTVEKLRTLQKFLADCPHGYHRYGWVLPLIQLWHMGWADLERILNTFWGSSPDDLSSFLAMNIILGRKVTNSKRPDYYPAQHLVFDTLTATVLDLWRIHLGTTDFEAHFQNNATPFGDLLKMATEITQTYMTSRGVVSARYGKEAMANQLFKTGNWSPGHGTGETTGETSRTPTTADEDIPSPGDQVLVNSLLRVRDSMWHYVFQWAISDGDIGQAMNVMAVWTFTFMGCGKTKYTNELLELACNFLTEYSPELCLAIMNNWLCNLSGHLGCFFPMDLLQEKNIKRLKQMAQRRDASFGGDFFKNIVALNIRACIQSVKSMKTAVRLNDKSESHTTKKRVVALREATRKMAQQQLHLFCEGRSTGWRAQDDYSKGFNGFEDGKRLQDFIERTIRDSGDLHGADTADVEAEMAAEMEAEEWTPVALPNMIVDGMLVSADDLDEDDNLEDGGNEGVLGHQDGQESSSSSDEGEEVREDEWDSGSEADDESG